MNMVPDSTTPIVHANFFCRAPTYSGDWLCTIKRPTINVGENLGLTKTRMTKSARKMVKTYLIGKKLFLKMINIREMKVAKNNIPAAALISLSFKTRMLWPFAFSPNCIILFICLFLLQSIVIEHFWIKRNRDVETSSKIHPGAYGSQFCSYVSSL